MKFLASFVALTCFLATVSARIQLSAPSNATVGGRSVITWTHNASDPAEFLLMLHPANDSFATAQFWDNVQTSLDKLDVEFNSTTVKIGRDYLLTARNSTNVDFILASSPAFQFQNATTNNGGNSNPNITTVITTTTPPSTTTTPGSTTTTTPPANQQTTTTSPPTQGTNSAAEGPGASTNNNSAAGGLAVSGGILVAALGAGLASVLQFY